MSGLRDDVHGQFGSVPFFVAGLSLDGLRQEIFFLAYHLHWSWQELMWLDSDERRAFVRLLVDQIERENAHVENQGGR